MPKPTQEMTAESTQRGLRLRPVPPLESLVSILPPLLLYEIGALYLETAVDGGPRRIAASHLLQTFFSLFGTTGMWLPGLAVVVILLATHVTSRRTWSINRRSVLRVYAESAILALPLVLFCQTLQLTASPPIVSSGWTQTVVLGIGAGIYEEAVFRLILIPLLLIVAVDLLQLPSSVGMVVAAVLSALAFSAHHHPPIGSDPFDPARFAFRTVAGVYLGVIFLTRGYGCAAGAHTAYNLMVIGLSA